MFCNTCKTNKKICSAPANHVPAPIPLTFNGAALGSHGKLAEQTGQIASPQGGWVNAQASPACEGGVSPNRQSDSQECGSLQGASDDKLNVAIMVMHAGSPEQPVGNKGR